MGEPVVITGPNIGTSDRHFWGFKKGKDNILRFTPVGVTVLNFTEKPSSSHTVRR